MNASLIVVSSAGCLLPFLIMANLFLGWLFMPARLWLSLEAAFVFFFFLQSFLLVRKVSSMSAARRRCIDVEGTVVGNDDTT